jgi:Ni2+-binding GTPase involved in maturation of urease and hydrogenase
MTSVCKKAVTTGGTLKVELGGELVKGLNVVVADSTSVNAVDTGIPTVAGSDYTRVTKGDVIEIVGDSTFASAGEVWVQLTITPVTPFS